MMILMRRKFADQTSFCCLQTTEVAAAQAAVTAAAKTAGNTNLAAGVAACTDLLALAPPNLAASMVLITDGQPNR